MKFIVGCTARKTKTAQTAKVLYSESPWFRALSNRLDLVGAEWAVASAKHGLLFPRDVVAPYDYSIKDVEDVDAWAQGIASSVDAGETVVLLMSSSYRKPLRKALKNKGVRVVCPLTYASRKEQTALFLSSTACTSEGFLRDITLNLVIEAVSDDACRLTLVSLQKGTDWAFTSFCASLGVNPPCIGGSFLVKGKHRLWAKMKKELAGLPFTVSESIHTA